MLFFGESQVCLMDIGNNKRPWIDSGEQSMDLKSRNLDLSLRVSNLYVTLRIHDLWVMATLQTEKERRIKLLLILFLIWICN